MSGKRASSDDWISARAAWEADPTLSFGKLAERIGVSKQSVSKRAAREGWERPANLADLAKKAHARADKMAVATVVREAKVDAPSPSVTLGDVDVDAPKNDAVEPVLKNEPPPKAKPAKPEHDAAAVQEAAISLRADINARHRNEWNAARQLSYEAIKGKDFERAKLAKITSETIKIIQEGERKAWGLDVTEPLAGPSVVVIERSSS